MFSLKKRKSKSLDRVARVKIPVEFDDPRSRPVSWLIDAKDLTTERMMARARQYTSTTTLGLALDSMRIPNPMTVLILRLTKENPNVIF